MQPSILSPVDTITITIDNRLNPPSVSCNFSREIPYPQVVGLMAAVIQQLSVQTIEQFTQAKPTVNP